jgi:hypothetical protein
MGRAKMNETEQESTAFYLRCRINDALQGRKTALKFWCPISYRQATNRIRKARNALRRHNARRAMFAGAIN